MIIVRNTNLYAFQFLFGHFWAKKNNLVRRTTKTQKGDERVCHIYTEKVTKFGLYRIIIFRSNNNNFLVWEGGNPEQKQGYLCFNLVGGVLLPNGIWFQQYVYCRTWVKIPEISLGKRLRRKLTQQELLCRKKRRVSTFQK